MKKMLIILFGFANLILHAQGWQHESLSIEKNLNAIQFIDINHGWIVGDSGIILKYDLSDWTSIESEFSTYNLTELYFTDSVHGWIIGENGVILQYNNDTISMVASPTDKNLNDIYMINENYGWIGGNDRTILKYSENNWSIYPTDSFSFDLGNLKNIQFLDSAFGIFIGGNNFGGFTILNYEDGEWYEDINPTNTTWLKGLFIQDKENIITSENQKLLNINWGSFIKYNSLTGTHDYIGSIGSACWGCEIDFGEKKGWAISGLQIFEYKNNGFVEYENKETITKQLNSICVVNDSIGWMVGNNGTLLKYSSQISNILEIDKNKIEVYPNPFQEYFFIKSAIPINYIDVFDTVGTKIESVKGYNEFLVKLNLGNLPVGMYLLIIRTEDSVFVHKILKK
jgi:photosystem II stability/assembly factor-like uncharacterized protein